MRLLADYFHSLRQPFLARAYELALQGLRTTHPNPMVGCVIVKNGHIVGEGWHSHPGGPHAEILALESAGEDARDATVFVTLEPCDHTGKTGPCTEALINAGVKKVVIGQRDPNPVAAGGAATLASAGIEVEFADDDDFFSELTRGFVTRLETGKPYVRVKVALSLDGSLGLTNEHSTAVTGPSGSTFTKHLRSYADAVVVSGATATSDNPQLTLRTITRELAPSQPARVILVRNTVPPPDIRVFTQEEGEAVLLLPSTKMDDDFSAYNARLVFYPAEEGLSGALTALGDEGFNSILIEPGRKLFTALINGRHIDELVTVTAGGFLGERSLKVYDGLSMLHSTGAPQPVLEHRLIPFDTQIYGDVVATMWRPAYPEIFEGERQQ